MKDIGGNVRNARKKARLTQAELAQKTNLSRSHIGAIETNRYNPSLSTLKVIADAVGVSVSTLVGGEVPNISAQDGIFKPLIINPAADLSPKEAREIESDLEDMMNSIASAAYEADDAEKEDIEALKAALHLAMMQAKRIAKKKYTPKKYRKD
jgi:transcriptional regulator with XRE-family HTH domain